MKAINVPQKTILAALVSILLPLVAFAQSNVALGGLTVDTSAAVEVSADTLSVDQATGKAVFSGNVVIGQGDLRVSAGSVEVIYADDTGDIASLIASDGVTFVTATEAAEAQSATYDLQAGTLLLTGNVLLTQGPNALSAETMTINVADGTASMEGRVRTVLQQQEEN